MLSKNDFLTEMLFWLSEAERVRKLGYERKAELYETRARFYAKKLTQEVCELCDEPKQIVQSGLCASCWHDLGWHVENGDKRAIELAKKLRKQ